MSDADNGGVSAPTVHRNTAGLKPAWAPGQSGNPNGRPKGSRNKLAEDFVAALYEDFTKAVEEGGKSQGMAAVAHVRENDPSTYVRVIAGLMPRDVTLKVDPWDELGDAELRDALDAVRALRAGPVGAALGTHSGPARGGEQAN